MLLPKYFPKIVKISPTSYTGTENIYKYKFESPITDAYTNLSGYRYLIFDSENIKGDFDCSTGDKVRNSFGTIFPDDIPDDRDHYTVYHKNCHKQFDEATAILAGDALQALAFTLLSQAPHINAEQKIALIERLSIASGSLGMAGGQAIDLNATGKTLTLAELENMHSHKTGAIIRAAVTMPADCGNLTNPETQQHLDHFAKSLGLAFQIHDDILDIESPTNVLGKTSQKDIAQNKATYPSLLGLEKSKEKRAHLLQQGLLCLKKIDADTHYLEAIAEYIIKRIR